MDYKHTIKNGDYKMINRQCTLLSDSLAKAIERVCKQKDYENIKKREKTIVINDDGQIYDPTDLKRKITEKEIIK